MQLSHKYRSCKKPSLVQDSKSRQPARKLAPVEDSESTSVSLMPFAYFVNASHE